MAKILPHILQVPVTNGPEALPQFLYALIGAFTIDSPIIIGAIIETGAVRSTALIVHTLFLTISQTEGCRINEQKRTSHEGNCH